MRSTLPRLHIVTNNEIADLPDLDRRAADAARAAPVAFHARTTNRPGGALTDLAEHLRAATHPAGSMVFVNDRADVALLVEADGVHLPAGGLPVSAVRALLGCDVWIGRSVHHPDEAQRAADEGADYVFLGPIWETPTHPHREGLGVAAIERVSSVVRVIAIGGVTAARVGDCASAGAYGVATISALWTAADPGAVAAEMSLLLGTPDP